MRQIRFHPWNLSFREAKHLQETLAAALRLSFPDRPIRYVAGADVSFNRFSPTLYAGIVVMTYPELHVIEERWAVCSASFPYVPGYLSFREAPAVLSVFERLETLPDVMILDGQGIAHPRGLGLAAHVGLLLNLPTIGCAKSLLIGDHAPVDVSRGASVPLTIHGREVGRVLRTRHHVKPVYVSPGHLMDVAHAAEIVLQCCPRYRLPEPTRQAHRLVNRIRKDHANDPASV